MAKKSAPVKKVAKKAAKSKSKSKADKASNAIGPVSASNRQNISIRKIDNGYVTSRSYTRNGQYIERESFSRTQPKVVVSGGGSK